MWCYGATAHFKGRHDSEGGAVKRGLAEAIQAEQSPSNLLNNAALLQAYASLHLTIPAKKQEQSAAHRDRARSLVRSSAHAAGGAVANQWAAHRHPQLASDAVFQQQGLLACAVPGVGMRMQLVLARGWHRGVCRTQPSACMKAAAALQGQPPGVQGVPGNEACRA
eukprot:scaffold221022_cov19-Tisochrysis_lutea.AAC.1